MKKIVELWSSLNEPIYSAWEVEDKFEFVEVLVALIVIQFIIFII